MRLHFIVACTNKILKMNYIKLSSCSVEKLILWLISALKLSKFILRTQS